MPANNSKSQKSLCYKNINITQVCVREVSMYVWYSCYKNNFSGYGQAVSWMAVSVYMFPGVGFLWFLKHFIQHCFILLPLRFDCLREDASIEPRTIATLSLVVKRCNHWWGHTKCGCTWFSISGLKLHSWKIIGLPINVMTHGHEQVSI
jgi:hypothetical protein